MADPHDTEPAGIDDATLLGTLGASTHTDVVASQPRAAVLARGDAVGRYLVLESLGRGAAGEVFAAYDSDLDRRVALKLLHASAGDDPARRRRALAEAQAMARVQHPNVTAVFDVGVHAGRLYIAMELVEGTTLGAWLRSRTRTRAEILAAFSAAARGLAAAHAVGVVHGDFKPDNVLVEQDRDGVTQVRVADFGLSRLDMRADADARGPVGTPAYMAPEQHAGASADARSDQFAFSVALFEALWGHRPFTGSTLMELAAATCDGRIDLQGEAAVPLRLRRVVLRGLAVEPAARHADMAAVLDALAKASRPRWPWALAGGAGLAVLASWLWSADADARDCPDAATLAAQAWSPTLAERVTIVRADVSPSVVQHARARVERELAGWAASWAERSAELCLAEPVAMDAGAARCLDEHRVRFDDVVQVFVTRSVGVSSADALLAALPPPRLCGRGTDASLGRGVEDDAELRAELRASSLRRFLGDDARSRLAGLAELRARARGLPHLLVSIDLEIALTQLGMGDEAAALATLDDVTFTALRQGFDRQAANAVIVRLELASQSPTLARDVERWTDFGRALLERSGGDDELSLQLTRRAAIAAFATGDAALAVTTLAAADAAIVQAYGDDSTQVALHRKLWAVGLTEQGAFDAAAQRIAGVRAQLERELGPQHHDVIDTLSIEAAIADGRGEGEVAVALGREALARLRASGPAAPSMTSALAFNAAEVAARRGLVTAAAGLLVRARAAWPSVGEPVADAQFESVEVDIALACGADELALARAHRAHRNLVGAAPNQHALVERLELAAALARLGAGQSTEAVAELQPRGGDGGEPRFRVAREALAVIAATERGDAVAAMTALAWLEAAAPPRDDALVELARWMASDLDDAEARRSAAQLRPRLVAQFYGGHPWVAALDRRVRASKAPPRRD